MKFLLIAGRLWTKLCTLVDRRESAEPLALFRILVACVLLATLVSARFHGGYEAFYYAMDAGGMLRTGGSWRLDLLGGPTPAVIDGLWWVCVTSALLVLIGLCTRISAFVGLHAYAAFHDGSMNSGADWLICDALWLLVLSQSDATWSLACRLRHGRFHSSKLIPCWPRYLAILQLLLVYTLAGVQKVGVGWSFSGGYAGVYNVLHQPHIQRIDLTVVAGWAYPATQVMSFVTVYWEMLAPLVLVYLWAKSHNSRGGFWPRVIARYDIRSYYLAVGLGLHLGIAIAIDVGYFSWVTLAFYPCCYSWTELRARFTKQGWSQTQMRGPAADGQARVHHPHRPNPGHKGD